MDPAFRAIAADTIKRVFSAYFDGNPLSFSMYDIYVPGDDLSSVSSLSALQSISASVNVRLRRPGVKEAVEISREIVAACDRLALEVKRRTGRKQKLVGFENDLGSPNLVRAVFSGGGPVPVPPDMKAEMAEMARAGVSVFDISVQYGYPEPDVARILKSAGVKLAVLPPPPPAAERVPDLGVTDHEELLIAETLLSGGDKAEATETADVTLEQVDAVKSAWSQASPSDAISNALWRQYQRRREPDEPKSDPTSVGEVLICQGGPGGYRIEVAPQLEAKLLKALDALRSQTIKGGDTTEHDVVFTNLARFANRDLPQSEKRFKTFSYRGTTIHEFKGFQARVFAGTLKSVYPGGVEVWRCGLLHCVVKKRDEHSNVDLDTALEGLALWREWRRLQDAKIAKGMK